METLSISLALCEGNPPATVDSPLQGPVLWSFGIFFNASLNKLLSKESSCRWFEMPSGMLHGYPQTPPALYTRGVSQRTPNNNVFVTSKRPRDVVLTSQWRYYCVVCPLGWVVPSPCSCQGTHLKIGYQWHSSIWARFSCKLNNQHSVLLHTWPHLSYNEIDLNDSLGPEFSSPNIYSFWSKHG